MWAKNEKKIVHRKARKVTIHSVFYGQWKDLHLSFVLIRLTSGWADLYQKGLMHGRTKKK